MSYTKTDWYNDESKRTELSKLLVTSPLKDALDALIFDNLPGESGDLAPNDAVGRALLNDRREGFCDFYRQLLALAKPQAEPHTPKPTPGAWEHIRNPKQKPAVK